MISRATENECFVYITLPGQTEFVTAGKFVLAPDRRGNPSGKFVYGRSYLESDNSVPIDPLELKLVNKTYETNILKGVFGALRDSSPDYWGRRVIEKRAGLTELGEVDYLLHSPDDRAGALGFGRNAEPPAPRREFNQTMELQRLQELADAIIADEDIPDEPDAEQAQDLMFGGTSMGGARPKAVVEDNNALWIAKFNHPDDKWNDARVEHAMMMLARDCGIHTADSKVITIGDRDVLMVKRFDREHTEAGYRRGRMLSAMTLLRADDAPQRRDNWSYVSLVEELRRISSQPKEDAPELFRRMVFNALISNIDDHPRNHAVIAMDTDWKFSPAYDLTPSTPISADHRDLALECGDMGRFANAENLLTQCERFYLAPDHARIIIDQMEVIVRDNWYAVARREEVTGKDCEKIATAFNYPGFRLEAAA
ncbi:MAG: type II toxin-antitoxin system HipA family toxin [Gammaproteobacteria bacterium]|nr:type II toxin-antitoxin system HipA family toxin [Gammaproteobacteria bacterium]